MVQPVECPQCGKVYKKVPPKAFGKRVRCRDCEAVIQIPAFKTDEGTSGAAKRVSKRRPADDGSANEPPRLGARVYRRKKSAQSTWRQSPIPAAENDIPTEKVKKNKKSGKAKRRKKTDDEGWSLRRRLAAMAVLFCMFGWALIAGRYAKDEEGWIPGMIDMEPAHDGPPGTMMVTILRKKVPFDYLINAFKMTSKTPRVVVHSFTQAKGLLVGIVISYFIVAGGLYAMDIYGERLAEEDRRNRQRW